MNYKKTTARAIFISLAALAVLSACGQKGPLIVDRSFEDVIRTQEGLPQEISPDDGSESESEAVLQVQDDQNDQDDEQEQAE